MPHVRSFEEVTDSRRAFVTLGVFDGVHRGHQHLIGQMVRAAHAEGCAAVVVTFFPHPAEILRGKTPAFYLNRPDEKAALIESLGADWVVTHPFSLEVSRITAAEFVDRMLGRLWLAALWAGHDFALGHKRQGTIDYLTEQGRAKGFRVRVVEPLTDQDAVISSSAVRAALQGGEVELAARYLGRPYALSGEVIHGAERGRAIGFPTANLSIWEDQACPAYGVYASWARLGEARLPAATSIGVRPTFEVLGLPTVEAYLLDFDGDLYGRHLSLEFVSRLRAELKFDGVETLVAQMQRDVEQTREELGVQ